MRRVALALIGILLLSAAAPAMFVQQVVAAQALTPVTLLLQTPASRLIAEVGFQVGRGELPLRSPAVAVDIDADGDKDLVVNVGSLDLGVWINDGTGRLTRARTPDAAPAWAPVPPVPTFHSEGTGLIAAVPDESSSTPPAAIRAGPVPQLGSPVVPCAASFTPRVLCLSRPTRAPPLA